MKHVFLYFGSFNPIHKGHMALAEHVIGQGLCDGVIFIVSPQNPLKEADGLMPELARFEMVETACLESKYPQAIQASAIEFLLDKPSYTIDTLRYLTQNHGKEMRFSVLMGADIIPQLDKWKDYRELLDKYDIYVYPRKGYAVDRYLDRITYLADAPTFEYSSTEIRERAARDVPDDGHHALEQAEHCRPHKGVTEKTVFVTVTGNAHAVGHRNRKGVHRKSHRNHQQV